MLMEHEYFLVHFRLILFSFTYICYDKQSTECRACKSNRKFSNFYSVMEKLLKNISKNQQPSTPKCTPCGIYFATKGKLNNHMINFHMTNR